MAEPSPSKNLSTSSCGVSASRPAANPNLRNSESTDPKRRSFVGSPFPRPSINPGQRGSGGGGGFLPNTPANSPSDYRPRRNSFGKENMSLASRDNQKTENNTDQMRKPGKVQSPAATKGSKHFMSPTISAASKVNASPRKKVLVEKDEPIRTSISLSGGKLSCMEGLDSKPGKGLNQKKEVSFDSNVTYLGGDDKEEAFQSEDDLDSKVDSSSADDDMHSLLETENEEKDLVNLDPSFKISTTPGNPSPLPTSSLASSDAMPPLSPLDADPYTVPYDPKTNYLSPRPRFLHYKHNPRVELYFQKGRSGDLKERFSAESQSIADVTEDEVSSDGFHVETEDFYSDVASDDGSFKKEEEEEDELAVSEVDHTSASEAESEVAEVKKTVKRHVVTRTKLIPILFILASVGLYLSFYSSPVMDPSVLNNLNFPELYVPPELSNFARESLEQVKQRIQQLWQHCVSFLHNLILGFSQQHNTALVEYANLTSLLEDSSVDEGSVSFSNTAFQMAAKFGSGSSWHVIDEDVNLVSVMESSQHIEATTEVAQGDFHDKESEDEEEIEALGNLDLSLDHTSNEADSTNMSGLVDDSALEAALDVEEGQQDNSEHQESDTFAQVEVTPDDSSATLGAPEANIDTLVGISELQSITVHEERTEAPSEEETLDVREPESEIDATIAEIQVPPIMETTQMASEHTVAGIAVLALIGSLLAAYALLHKRTPRALPTTDATLASQTIKAKASPLHAPIEQNSQQPILSTNSLTEVAYTGDEDTCTSAMSGSQPAASSSQRKGLNVSRTTQEARSHESRGQRTSYSRRESSASSGGGYSMDSKSYGSFTTYEKLPAKHNVGGEEPAVMITPVRRSSRLRSKVGSPGTSDMINREEVTSH